MAGPDRRLPTSHFSASACQARRDARRDEAACSFSFAINIWRGVTPIARIEPREPDAPGGDDDLARRRDQMRHRRRLNEREEHQDEIERVHRQRSIMLRPKKVKPSEPRKVRL